MPSGTGVIAEIGAGQPLVGLRADIDGLPIAESTGLPYSSTLPNVSHACGHDVHLTVLLGLRGRCTGPASTSAAGCG